MTLKFNEEFAINPQSAESGGGGGGGEDSKLKRTIILEYDLPIIEQVTIS